MVIGLGVIYTDCLILSFLTVTSIGQREEHISQTLATFFSVPPVTALAFKFRFNVASVPIAAVLFKKFRLFIKTPYL